VDGGNLGTHHETAGVGGTVQRFDYFSEFANLQTDNDLPNNKYRTKTYAGRFGVALGHASDLSGTDRWIDTRFESPNDELVQRTFLPGQHDCCRRGFADQRQQATVRFGASDLRTYGERHHRRDRLRRRHDVQAPAAKPRAGVCWIRDVPSDSRSARQGIYSPTSYQVILT
jgi:hypothetical protein